MEQKQEIIIDLEGLEKTEALEAKDLIYRSEFEKLSDEIVALVGKNAMAPDGQLLYQPCFFINGSRGSGKTTFLRALRKKICNGNKEGGRIHLLADMDPTTLADGESFFVHLMSRVQKILDDRKEEFLEDKPKKLLRHLRKCTSELNNGLASLIHRPDTVSNMADALFYVQESVEGGMSSATLQKQFAEVIENLCEYIKADAILVTIDDADMNFCKCREIFETVRKYLLNKRMIFVFAGDLKLYSLVVRGMQMQHFGDVALKHDPQRSRQRQELLDDLENQYIMKLFPVYNRVRLGGFGGLLAKDVDISHIGDGEKPRREKLETYIFNTLPARVPCCVPWLVENYMSQLHVRSSLQLLAYWSKNITDKTSADVACRQWSYGVHHVTSNALVKHNINANKIYEDGLQALMKAIRSYVRTTHRGIDAATFVPAGESDSERQVAFFLSTEVSRQVRTPFDLLSYILHLFPLLQKDDNKEVILHSNIICELPEAYERQIAANSTAVMLPVLKEQKNFQKWFANGVIPLFSREERAFNAVQKRLVVKDCLDKMASIFKGKHGNEKPWNEASLLYYIAILNSLSLVVDHDRGYYCLSVYNLLAFTIRLLDVDISEEKPAIEQLRGVLFSFNNIKSAMRNVNVVEPLEGNDKTDDLSVPIRESLEGIINDESNKDVIDSICENLQMWLSKCNESSILVTAAALVEGWQTFIRECILITKASRLTATQESDLVAAGDLFGQYVDAFCKSLTICLESENDSPVDNPLITCPIWEPLLNPQQVLPELTGALNKVNMGTVKISYMHESLRSLFEVRLRNRISRLEYRYRDLAGEKLSKLRASVSEWCETESEKIQTLYTNSVYAQLKKDNPRFKSPLYELPEAELAQIQAYVDVLIKNMKRRNEQAMKDLRLDMELELAKEEKLLHAEILTNTQPLWDALQPELKLAESEEEAADVVNRALNNFMSAQNTLIATCVENVESKAYLQIGRWKKLLETYVNKTTKKGLPAIAKRKK
ncbi:MAG: hypothetical protein IKJ29_03525 [Akkermansia sp.]|nr:hypothetical protein [Akkermansia sp.]